MLATDNQRQASWQHCSSVFSPGKQSKAKTSVCSAKRRKQAINQLIDALDDKLISTGVCRITNNQKHTNKKGTVFPFTIDNKDITYLSLVVVMMTGKLMTVCKTPPLPPNGGTGTGRRGRRKGGSFFPKLWARLLSSKWQTKKVLSILRSPDIFREGDDKI